MYSWGTMCCFNTLKFSVVLALQCLPGLAFFHVFTSRRDCPPASLPLVPTQCFSPGGPPPRPVALTSGFSWRIPTSDLSCWLLNEAAAATKCLFYTLSLSLPHFTHLIQKDSGAQQDDRVLMADPSAVWSHALAWQVRRTLGYRS